MINEKFYERERLPKKKAKDKSKKRNLSHPYQSQQNNYDIGNLLSDVGNREIANFLQSGLIQAKLNVSRSGDMYEQEADRIAKNIANTKQEPQVSRIQTKSFTNNSSVEGNAESKIKSLTGKGNSLDKSVKEYFEPRFGVDLGNVRVHTDGNANLLAKAINARAFTYGNDIVFGQGQYQPATTEGKKLIAHELAHTRQQMGSKLIVQRDPDPIKPEDVSSEMIGKEFILNSTLQLSQSYTGTFLKGTIVTIKTWDNSKDTVTVTAKGVDNISRQIIVKKFYLQPVQNTSAGLYQYSKNVSSYSKTVEKKSKEIEAFKKKKPEYEKYKNLKGYEDELKRLQNEQENRNHELNARLIQETMFNIFDDNIKKWTNYYNKEIGEKQGWDKLDPNLVKSMIFQESQMGTAGKYMYDPPRHQYDRMSRFNIMQAVDSSGPIILLMLNEMDPALAAKYNISKVVTDLYKAQKKVDELEKKIKDKKTLTTVEQVELQEIRHRTGKEKQSDKYNWNHFYWTDPYFYGAWKEFIDKSSGKKQNLDYDFWIRTGIRWLFEKRKSVNSWEEAIRAYNGSGARAKNYKENVIERRNRAKNASQNKSDFIPTLQY